MTSILSSKKWLHVLHFQSLTGAILEYLILNSQEILKEQNNIANSTEQQSSFF